MFDEIRVYSGTEFYLVLGMQELYEELRRNQNKSSYQQTQSRKAYASFVVFCLFVLTCYCIVNFFILLGIHSCKLSIIQDISFFSHMNLLLRYVFLQSFLIPMSYFHSYSIIALFFT